MQIVRNIKTGLEFEATPDLIKFAKNRNNNLEVIEVEDDLDSVPPGVHLSGYEPDTTSTLGQPLENGTAAAEIIDPVIESAPVVEQEQVVEQPLEVAQVETVVEEVVTPVVEQAVAAEEQEQALPLVDSANDDFAPLPKNKKK